MTTVIINKDAVLIKFNTQNKKKKWESYIIKNKSGKKDQLSLNIDNELINLRH